MWRALRYAIDEAAASLWRGRQSALLSTATIALALFVLGGFLLVTANLDRLGAEWGRAAELSVYLKDDISLEDRRAIEELLAPGDTVASHEYVSKADALVRFKQTFAALAALGMAFFMLRARYLVPLASAVSLTKVHFLSVGTCALVLAGGMAVGCLGGLVAGWHR